MHLNRTVAGVVGFVVLAAACIPAAGDSIEEIISQASVEEYQSYVRTLTGDLAVPGAPAVCLANRSSFYLPGRVAAYWLRDTFAAWGLNASLHTFDTEYGPNVVAEQPGITRPQDIYIICAHYDTDTTDVQHLEPGCDDNASGTAAVLMAARILSQYQFEGTLRFIAFCGEEQGLVGSRAYAEAALQTGENIVAAINLDMILHPGFDNLPEDPDYDIDIEGNNPSQWLAQHMASTYTTYTSLNVEEHNDGTGASDHRAFWDHGYYAVGLSENTVHEVWAGSNDTYHQATDTIEDPDFDWDFALQVVRGGMAGLIDLAELVPDRRGPAQLARAARPHPGQSPSVAAMELRSRRTSGRTATLYVNAAGGDDTWNGQCATWDGNDCGPKATIQAALDVAAEGDTVLVADGRYIGPGNRNLDFHSKALTLQSVGGAGNCYIDCQAAGRGFVFQTGETAASVVDGFTICGAVTTGDGSGVLCDAACNPTIMNCVISANVATGHGGGVYCGPASAPTIVNTTITGNGSAAGGGGVYCDTGSAPSFTGCAVTWNMANDGAGAYCIASAPTFDACTFHGNLALVYSPGGYLYYGDGGALLASTSTLLLTACTIDGNIANIGGGIRCEYGSLSLADCDLAANSALSYAGAVCADGTALALSGAHFSGNRATTGAAVDLEDQPGSFTACRFAGNQSREAMIGWFEQGTSFTNCLFVGNDVSGYQATLCWGTLSAVNCTFGNNVGFRVLNNSAIVNCVLWDGTSTEISNSAASYCDIRGGWPGTGNLSADPLFVDGPVGTWTSAGSYNWRTGLVTLTDAGASWTPGEFIGAAVNPDTTQALEFLIVANTPTTLQVWADAQTTGACASWVGAATSYAIHDYHLSADSPCVHAGTNDAAGLPATDLDGAPRIQRCHIDMGAFESPYQPPDMPDCNGNGVDDACDLADGTSPDCNSNAIPDECDVATGTSPDCNLNGTPDECDVAYGVSLDCNGNGIPEECEPLIDCNQSGATDTCDIFAGTSLDCNANWIPDECDISGGMSADCHGDGIPDECQLTDNDCNQNSIPDDCDISSSVSADCQGDGIPDECQLTDNDCNQNSIPDECEGLADCNGNGTWDTCELGTPGHTDCNNNGVLDECDVAWGPSLDCNGNGLPDECDVADGSSADCNTNTIPDECDIADGTSLDVNGNGVPDECEACVGDLNCDAVVDFLDINAFVLYLSNFPVWQTTYAGCDAAHGDIDGNGEYPSFGDINPFVTLLSTSSLPLPCASR